MRLRALLAAVIATGSAASPALACDVNENVAVSGYFQQWYTATEGMPEAEGNYQSPSRDEAVDEASGFRFARARISLRARTTDDRFGLHAQLRLERDPQLLDLYGRVTIAPWLSLHAGQMKIPSTYENLASASALDFILRSRMTGAAVDYALSRTTDASSPFYGNSSQQRDLGVAAKGELKLGPVPLRYFAMASNGLGANLFVGGQSGREHVAANNPGDLFLGLRAETDPWPKVIRLGGFASHNRHDNMLASGPAVIDLHRHAWGSDLQFDLQRSGMRAAVAWAAGSILDDFDGNARVDFAWSGWEWRVVWRLNPMLRLIAPSPLLKAHVFEAGFRYDVLNTESDESGVVVRNKTWTSALSYLYREWMKVQVNYVQRRTDDRSKPDLSGNAWLVNLQVKI